MHTSHSEKALVAPVASWAANENGSAGHMEEEEAKSEEEKGDGTGTDQMEART